MDQSEWLPVCDRVVKALCSYGEDTLSDEGQREQLRNIFVDIGLHGRLLTDTVVFAEEEKEGAASVLRGVSIQACLPVVSALFDDEGNMFLALSEEDTFTFKKLFKARWPVVEDTFRRVDVIRGATFRPERPAFIDAPESEYLRKIENDEYALWALLDDAQRTEYEDYSLQREFWLQAVYAAANILKPFKAAWVKENAQHDFLSLSGKARFPYDKDRGADMPEP